jgi:regulator of protease activity HflC (stomatin/prohibitin superfamily)
MGYIVFMLFFVIICGTLILLLPRAVNALLADADERKNEAQLLRSHETRALMIRTGIALFFIVVGGGLTVIRSVHSVQAGEVGLVYRFGDIVGQRKAGLSLIAPWETFDTADIKLQKIRPESKCSNGLTECLEAFSTETQDVFVQATLNISVNPTDVQDLYRTVGPDYADKVIRPRLLQAFKDETVKYKSVDIAPHREQIRAAAKEQLRTELSKFSINVDDLLIDNIDFRPEFKTAIEAKQSASQEALRQEALIAAKEAEAKQAAAEAQGASDKLRIEAEGQAAANRLITDSLSPLLIQFQAVQKLSDNVTVALIPSGQGIIIDPATLLGTKPTSP